MKGHINYQEFGIRLNAKSMVPDFFGLLVSVPGVLTISYHPTHDPVLIVEVSKRVTGAFEEMLTRNVFVKDYWNIVHIVEDE